MKHLRSSTAGRNRNRRRALCLAGALALPPAVGACAPDAPAAGAPVAEAPAADAPAYDARTAPRVPEVPTSPVDSVFPMDVMLGRFRAEIPEPDGFAGAADSRDALVARVVRALELADTAAFEEMAVTLPEWAWLYFPTSRQAQPPYELPPGMAWLRVQHDNRTGVLRALGRLGGRTLDYRGYTCEQEPAVEGDNRVWVGCLVTLGRDGQEAAPIRLFSAILERNGRFAILSYANDF